MCGDALEINNNATVATCEYCATQQTLPKLYDDKRANMYDRANYFRRNKDVDSDDLPGEFLHLQVQDMPKLGFVQDMVRDIKNSELKR